MNILQQRAYHETLVTGLKASYKGVSALLSESLHSAMSNDGTVIDESSLMAHNNYLAALRSLGEAIENLDNCEGFI